MMKYESKFLNHACHFYENDEEIIIIDPWFFGKIFDKSWALLKEVEEEDINIQKIKHIFISHEHPDHLHWATLKFIRENVEGPVSVYITLRRNKNIFNNLVNLGFEVQEIVPVSREKLYDNFYYVQFPFARDSAFVFEVDGKIHLNQNDCYLDDYTTSLIKALIPKIDYWWMQFSLAGYYANRNDPGGLQKAKDYHLDVFSKYYSMFKPEVAIPFASYIYFCRKHNSYLNEWVVSLQEHVDKNPDINFQIPFCGDVIGKCNNAESISMWKKLIHQKALEQKTIELNDVSEEVSEHLIIRLADKWLKQTQSVLPYDQIAVGFFEEDKRFVFDFKNKKSFFTTNNNIDIAGRLTKEGLLCFVKFPWGADTLNIAAGFDILDFKPWRFLLEYKDSDYVR